jgi:N6-adenosine-specific RNA methylase IME4
MDAILKSKGFQYRAHCIWDKGNEAGTGQMGLGHWFRYEHEVLVVGARGDIPAPAPGMQWRSVIRHPRLRTLDGRIDHSRKPEIFADMVTEYFPTAAKLELFYRALEDPVAEELRCAKREPAGWFRWGNEATPGTTVATTASSARSAAPATGGAPRPPNRAAYADRESSRPGPR